MPSMPTCSRPLPMQTVALGLIAALACTVSVVLTVQFCWHLRGDSGLFAGVVAAAIGIAWETSKYVYAPAGVRLIASGRPVLTIGGLALCAISVVLVGGSITASLGYLAELDDRQRQAQLRSSSEFQDAQAQLTALDREIALLTQTASADADHSYRQRALATLATVRQIRAERDAIRERLAAIKAPASPAMQAGVFGGLANLLSVDALRIRSLAYGVVAVMLEAISLAALVLLGARRTSPSLKPQPVVEEEPMEHGLASCEVDVPETAPSPVVAIVTTDELTGEDETMPTTPDEANNPSEDEDRYERAKQLVLQAQVAPTYRALQSALQLGQTTAREFLATMEQDGILRRVGKRYSLVTDAA